MRPAVGVKGIQRQIELQHAPDAARDLFLLSTRIAVGVHRDLSLRGPQAQSDDRPAVQLLDVLQSLDVLVPFEGGQATPAVGGKRFRERKVRRGRENDLHEVILPRRCAIGTPLRRSAAVATSRR